MRERSKLESAERLLQALSVGISAVRLTMPDPDVSISLLRQALSAGISVVRLTMADPHLVDLGAKLKCLDFLTKAGPDRLPVVAPLTMMIPKKKKETWATFPLKGLVGVFPITVVRLLNEGTLGKWRNSAKPICASR